MPLFGKVCQNKQKSHKTAARCFPRGPSKAYRGHQRILRLFQDRSVTSHPQVNWLNLNRSFMRGISPDLQPYFVQRQVSCESTEQSREYRHWKVWQVSGAGSDLIRGAFPHIIPGRRTTLPTVQHIRSLAYSKHSNLVNLTFALSLCSPWHPKFTPLLILQCPPTTARYSPIYSLPTKIPIM